VRSFEVRLRMTTERQSIDVAQRHLERVRQISKQQGFHVSECHIRGVDGEQRDLLADREAVRG